MRDKTHREIKPGDVIAHADSYGLSIGIVIKSTQNQIEYIFVRGGLDAEINYSFYARKPERVMILEDPAIFAWKAFESENSTVYDFRLKVCKEHGIDINS
jgi:hypothetical protein